MAVSNQPVSDLDLIPMIQQNSLVNVSMPALINYLTQQNVYGATAANLQGFRTALAKTVSGQANTRVLCLGDSTTFGVASNGNNGTGGGNMMPLAYPTQLATILSNMGLPANAHSVAGFGSISFEDRKNNDGRVTMGSAWSKFAFAANQTAGGCLAQASTGTNALSYLPTANCDSFKIWGVKGGGNGVLSAAINAGTPTTHNFSGGALGIDSFTITGALGANTLNLTWSSGGTVYVSAIEAWNSAAPQVCITNAGWSGASIKDIDSGNSGASGYDPLAFALAYAPDLYVVSIGINDWRSGGSNISAATYQSRLYKYVAQLNAVSDVILVSPAPSIASNTSLAKQQGYVSAMQSVASTLAIPFVDNWTRFGARENNAAMYATFPGGPGDVHPNGIGYADFARSIARVMGNI